MYVPDVVKNFDVRVFNLLLRTNETRDIKCCNASVCNSKHRWDNDKCRCECKELTDRGVCDHDVIKDLFGILVIVNVDAINHVMLKNI